ncbi:MAG: AI-2E family transporter [Acidobacteriaceae bacterium]|nr:AI-2E family transporter [Acidobacteriaceae bacterium]
MPDVDERDVRNPFTGPRADLGRRAETSDTIIIGVTVIAGLYFGRDVLVPISIAVLLSFILAPLVDALSRLRIGRVASVLIAVALAFAILGVLGAIIGRQAAQLSESLPAYQAVISKKLDAVRSSALGASMVEKAADALHGLETNIGKNVGPTGQQPSQEQTTRAVDQPLQVEVHEPPPGPVQIVQSILSALLPPLATAAIVIIFVIFILLQRRDLRDRFIGLIGSDDLHRTTKALDDGARRLSRYFLALTGINASFGIIIGLGLGFIGVPNPILWGIVGAVLRFVPYAGALIAAAIPLALAAAVDPGWTMVAETALLFVIVEGIMGQVVEPQLFGHTTGMSPLAIIVAAGFWTLIWGAPGLLLSTPITACLVVLGRHVESLNFIELLLGDKPPLSPIQSFYQRILASDPDEVVFQAEALLKDSTLLDYYEQVALPALAMAQIDVVRGVMDRARQAEICDSVESVVASLSDYVDAAEQGPAASSVIPERSQSGAALCIAGRTPIDQAACAILAQLVEREHVVARVLGPDALSIRGISRLNPENVEALCVFYLGRQSLAVVRYAVRRLKKRFPGAPIAVCLWGSADLAPAAEAAQADTMVNSLKEAVAFCERTDLTQPTRTPVEAVPTPAVELNLGPEKLADV